MKTEPSIHHSSNRFPCPSFRRTANTHLKVIYSIAADAGFWVDVIGDPDNGFYEWIIREGDRVTEHSEEGYVIPSIALRDGLEAYWPRGIKVESPIQPVAKG